MTTTLKTKTLFSALQDKLDSFDGFAIDGRICMVPLALKGDGPMRTGKTPFVLPQAAEVEMTLSLCATRPFRTRLHAESDLPVSSRYRAIPPQGGQELALIRGIPFLTGMSHNARNRAGVVS